MTSQITSVGTSPTVSELLVGALLYSTVGEVLEVGRFVESDDLEEPGKTVLEAVKSLASRRIPPSSTLVADDLNRRGRLTRSVGVWLASATTSGACASAARHYAAALVAQSLRRQAESFGNALITLSGNGSEVEIAALVNSASARIRYVAGRLAELRGDVDE